MKKLVTYVCFHLTNGRQDIIFQYLVDSEEDAMQQFEKEAGKNIEINEILVDNLTDEEVEEYLNEEELTDEEVEEFFDVVSMKFI